MKISAAIAISPNQPFEVAECELANPGPNEILVEIRASGICHTDLVIKGGQFPSPFPRVLGHEGAGIVRAVGAGVSTCQVGDHVVLTFGSCGRCLDCHEGHPAYCHDMLQLNFTSERVAGPAIKKDGQPISGNFFGQSSFATYSLTGERNVVRVEKDVPFEVLAPLGCGIQTGFGTVMRVLEPRPGDSLVVFGTGAVGMAAVMAAKAAACSTIIAVDVHQTRLAAALELGATHAFRGDDANLVRKLIDVTGGGAHYSIDTTGVPSIVDASILCLRKRGATAQVAATPPDRLYNVSATAIRSKGLRISGAIEGDSIPWRVISQMIALYRTGLMPIDKIVTTFPLQDINLAIERMKTGEVIKPVLMNSVTTAERAAITGP